MILDSTLNSTEYLVVTSDYVRRLLEEIEPLTV